MNFLEGGLFPPLGGASSGESFKGPILVGWASSPNDLATAKKYIKNVGFVRTNTQQRQAVVCVIGDLES